MNEDRIRMIPLENSRASLHRSSVQVRTIPLARLFFSLIFTMVNIEEGVYIIRCVGNNEVLDLSNGTWSYGRVQTWQATSGGITSEGGWNQTWLLARVIGTNDEWHIINLHYGVQVGVFATERNITRSFTVKAAPTRHSAWSTRWIIKDEGNSSVRLLPSV